MRASLRRIVLPTPQRVSRSCIRCERPQLLPRNVVASTPHRSYSDIVKDSESKEDAQGVESTGTVPDDPDIITTESPEVQEPPPSSEPAVQSSPSLSKPTRTKEVWHFRLEEKKMDSASRAKELASIISQTSLRKKLHWFPPLHGVNPAYDTACAYLKRDRNQKIAVIKRLEARIAREKERGASVELLNQLENARYHMLVLQDINVPEIRWRFKQGDIDLRIPAHQHLYQQNWNDGQYVGKLMQRLTTMKIIPDSLHTLSPKVDFRLRFKDGKMPSRVRQRKTGWRDTEAGEMLSSKTLMTPPRMEIIPYHRDWWSQKKYTIVMLDLDVPDPENDSFRTKLHWMVKDIVASPIKSIIQPGNGETVVPYLPPHPYRGMKYHRYPIFVFEQPSDEWLATRPQVFQQHLAAKAAQPSPTEAPTSTTTETLASKISPLLATTTTGNTLRTYATESNSWGKYKYIWENVQRDDFNIRAWANQMGMKPVGAHLVRCEWDENVASILQKLGIKERAFKKIKSQETSPFDFPQ